MNDWAGDNHPSAIHFGETPWCRLNTLPKGIMPKCHFLFNTALRTRAVGFFPNTSRCHYH